MLIVWFQEKRKRACWGDSGHIPTVVQGQIVFRYVEICLWLTVACLGAGEGYDVHAKTHKHHPELF